MQNILKKLSKSEIKAIRKSLGEAQEKIFGNKLKNNKLEKLMAELFKVKNYNTLLGMAKNDPPSAEEYFSQFELDDNEGYILPMSREDIENNPFLLMGKPKLPKKGAVKKIRERAEDLKKIKPSEELMDMLNHEDFKHNWVFKEKYGEVCSECGFIKNNKNNNKSCKGKVKVELRRGKKQTSMKEITERISENNKRKPSKEKIDKLFSELKKEGQTSKIKVTKENFGDLLLESANDALDHAKDNSKKMTNLGNDKLDRSKQIFNKHKESLEKEGLSENLERKQEEYSAKDKFDELDGILENNAEKRSKIRDEDDRVTVKKLKFNPSDNGYKKTVEDEDKYEGATTPVGNSLNEEASVNTKEDFFNLRDKLIREVKKSNFVLVSGNYSKKLDGVIKKELKNSNDKYHYKLMGPIGRDKISKIKTHVNESSFDLIVIENFIYDQKDTKLVKEIEILIKLLLKKSKRLIIVENRKNRISKISNFIRMYAELILLCESDASGDFVRVPKTRRIKGIDRDFKIYL